VAALIDVPFGLWTRVGRKKHKFSRIRQVAPMCPYGRTYWRHLANIIKPSICGGDAALCQLSDYFDHLLWPPYGIGRPLYFCPVVSSIFFSSPNLSRRRLDACHTSTHGVALVRI